MYAPSYGYGPGNPTSQSFNPNGPLLQSPSDPHHPHHQQQPGGQPQQMMYNPQQYAAGPQQPPYAPSMGGNAAGMPMVQNNGLSHISGGGGPGPGPGPDHVASYQTPYTTSPYGSSIPSSTSGQLLPNFMPTTSNSSPNPPSFAMNNQNMIPQQMQAQRMPPPQISTPIQSGQRSSSYQGMPQNTPPNSGLAQPQFSTPQIQNPTVQTANNNQQSQAGTVVTPQTPNFPPGQGGSGLATPMSPGSEAREKDRVTLLLEINRELLLEVVRLQALQQAEKKDESAAVTKSPDGLGDKGKADKEKADKSKAVNGREYVECMRRLQANLAYLAAIADRTHKPSSQIPAHPAIISAPVFSARTPKSDSSPSTDIKGENASEETKNAEEVSEDRVELLKDQYKRLQALFPGVDPKKDAALQSANATAAARAQMQAKQQAIAQGGGGSTTDANQQQKLQSDLLRQKMMQQGQPQQSAQPGAGQTQNR